MIQFKKKKQKELNISVETLKVPRSFLLKRKKKNGFRKRKINFSVVGFLSKKAIALLLLFVLGSLLFFLHPFIRTTLYISPLPFTLSSQEDTKTEELIRKELQKHAISYASIVIDNSIAKIGLDEESDVYLSVDKDIKKQIASLQFILSRLTMEGRRFKRLDLRFENPVIVF